MNKVFRIALVLLFFKIAAALPACEEEAGENGAAQCTIYVSGRVRLVGNEPFTELVITGSDMEWYIEENEVYKLKDLHYRTVTVKGVETVIPVRFASGRSAGERRILKDIKIISVE
jgi:hypothetical protein